MPYIRKPKVKKNCKTCGREFETRLSRQIYCSKKCSSYQPNSREKKCVRCGKSFLAHSCQKYCSEECANFKESKLISRKCVVCGKEFLGYSKQKYCTTACFQAVYRRKRQKTKPTQKMEIRCVWCHDKILTYMGSKRFCDCNCSMAFQRVKHQIHMKHPFEDTTELIQQLEAKGKNFVLR